MSAPNPEQLAEAARKALANYNGPKGYLASASAQLADALRALTEATQAAPTFKPDDVPDKYRDFASEFEDGFGEWPGFITVPGYPDRLPVSHDQARRILEMLSSEDADQ